MVLTKIQVKLFLFSDSPLWKLLESSIESSDRAVALKAIEIVSFISVNWYFF